MLHTLSPTEKEVIILRYGVENNKEETLKSIASKYHISRERVRQIEKTALSKIKQNSHHLLLKEDLHEES
jgi:RNA polymerase primary sigma factor